MIITNLHDALVGYFITSYPTRAHGIIVIYSVLNGKLNRAAVKLSLNIWHVLSGNQFENGSGSTCKKKAQFSVIFCQVVNLWKNSNGESHLTVFGKAWSAIPSCAGINLAHHVFLSRSFIACFRLFWKLLLNFYFSNETNDSSDWNIN